MISSLYNCIRVFMNINVRVCVWYVFYECKCVCERTCVWLAGSAGGGAGARWFNKRIHMISSLYNCIRVFMNVNVCVCVWYVFYKCKSVCVCMVCIL